MGYEEMRSHFRKGSWVRRGSHLHAKQVAKVGGCLRSFRKAAASGRARLSAAMGAAYPGRGAAMYCGGELRGLLAADVAAASAVCFDVGVAGDVDACGLGTR